MSDFFQELDSTTKKTTETRSSVTGLTPERAALRDKIEQERDEWLQNRDRYQVALPQEQYEIINDAIANAEIPEDEAYRWASALVLNQKAFIPLDEAYNNLESYNREIWGQDTYIPKSNFKAIVDCFQLGENTLRQGFLGNQLMIAEIGGDTEKAQKILEEYNQLQEQNLSLIDAQDRRFWIEALKFTAQSAPFTGYVATAGLIGGLVSGGFGTGLAFAASMQQAQGLEYMELRQEGATKENALAFSVFSGSLQALVETAMGNIGGILGQNAIGAEAKKTIVEKVTGNLFKRLHYNGTFASLALKMGTEYFKENFEEGMEEVWQDLISKGSHALAAELEGYDIEPITAQKIAEDAWENFKGGAMGSLGLGVFSTAYNTAVSVHEYNALKTAAETIPSKEAFVRAGKESPVLEGMSDPQKTEILEKIHDNKKAKRDELIQKTQEDLAEVYEADEEVNITTDENGNEIEEEQEILPEYRTEEGTLASEYTEPHENNDGTFSSQVDFFDPDGKSPDYGHIAFTVDEENGTLTIDEFKTKKTRNYLRMDMFTELAGKYSGYNIVWNTKGEIAAGIKADLEALNPRGKTNGLNYFDLEGQSEAYKQDHRAKQEVLKQLEKSTKLRARERAGIVAIMDAIAKHQKKTFSEWYNNTFMKEGMFGDLAELEEAAKKQTDENGKPRSATGGMKFKQTVDGARAVIYAAENADFSTMAHELSHVWQKQLFGEDAAEAARIFGAQEVTDENGNVTYNWNDRTIRTNKLDENGNPVYISPAENFAYSFEKWLKDGKAPSKEQENVFRKFKEFMKHVIDTLRNFIDMKPEITEFFDKNLKVTDEMMNQAENEQALRWMEQGAQQSFKTEEETVNAPSVEDFEKAFDESLANDQPLTEEEIDELTKEEETSVTEEALKETKLDNVTQSALTDIVEDPDITEEQKKAAMLKATSEDYEIKQENIERYRNRTDLTDEEKAQAIDDIINNRTTDGNGGGQALSTLRSGKDIIFQGEMNFQIMGTLGAANLDEANGEVWRSQMLLDAQDMEEAGRSPKEIRIATGWEKGADGKWKFEIPDFTINENIETATKEYLGDDYPKVFGYDGRDENGIYNIRDPFIKLTDLIKEDHGLFKAYPELKRVTVFKGTEDERTLGSQMGPLISINDKFWTETENGNFTLKDPRHVLNHEIQHFIQDQEKFARGGNEDFARQNFIAAVRRKHGTTSQYNGDVEAYYEAQDNIDKINYVLALRKYMENPEAFRKSGNWFAYGSAFGTPKNKQDREEYLYKLIEKWSDETRAKLFNYDYEFWELNQKEDKELKSDLNKEKYKEKKYSEEAGKWLRAEAEIQKLKELSDFELYKRLAGEVESRNVQARAALTDEERRNTLLAETEDVAREDQLVLFQESVEARKEELLHEDTEEEKQIKNLMSELKHEGFYSLHDAAVKSLRTGDSIEFDAKRQHNIDVMQHLLDTNKGLMFYENGSDRFRTVTENVHPDQPGKYQVTWWDAKGPIMHVIRNDAESILDEIEQNEDIHAKNENEDILFQEETKKSKKEWQRRDNVAREVLPSLFSKKETKRILENFDRLYMTPWHKQAIESVLIRADMEDLFAGRPMSHNSKLGAPSASEYLEAIKGGKKGIVKYLKSSGIIGHAAKAGNAINSSYLSCEPSKECAEFCYAAKGNYAFPIPAVKSEMVSWFIEKYPVEAAQITIAQYTPMLEYEAGKALRLFDKGDISENWLKYIEKLNEKDIRCQIFSKRPELLRKVDPKKNVIMLSVDSSNMEIAFAPENNDLPIALVYSDIADLVYIEKLKDRFLNHGGVILPVKIGDDLLIDAKPKAMKALPAWTAPYLCPVDKGTAVIEGQANEDGKPVWYCGRCNSAGGIGCFYHRVTAIRARLEQIDETPLNEREQGEINEQIRIIEELANQSGEIGSIVRSELARLLSQIRQGYDPETEAGSLDEANSVLRGKSRNGRKTEGTERTSGSGSEINFQESLEEEKVRQQYQNTESWLKAPNGQDTKLTEKQWLQVRTPNFKKWFGDWESDPENSSKVVDENGEPLVMYHGTRAEDKFEVFNTPPAGDKDNIGAHFGPRATAEEFSEDNIFEVFLDIKKPFIPNFDFFADTFDNAYLSELIHMKQEINTEAADKIFNKIYDVYPDLKESYDLGNMSDEDILEEFEDDENLVAGPDVYSPRNAMVDIMYELMEAGGYDGMKYNNWYEGEKNNECYVAIEPTQIKSATENSGAFDKSNPSILFQNDLNNGINDEILNEAAQFKSWVEYMEYGQVFGIEGAPEDAAADWYRNTWEIANNVSPTTKEIEEAEELKRIEQSNSRRDPVSLDVDFMYMIKKPGNLEAFLKLVYKTLHVDEEDLASMDPDEAQYVMNIIGRTERTFNHGTWRYNLIRVNNDKPLSDKSRKIMLTLIRQRIRDYRAIYADITGQSEYKVETAETGDEELFKRGRKYNHVKYLYEVENMSPEEKTKLDKRITDDEIRDKFKKDNVKMLDPDVEHYIGMVEAQEKKLAKELADQRREFNEDIERLQGMQERDIIRQYNQYLNLKGEADERNIRLPAGLKNIVKSGENFIRNARLGRKRNYNNLVEDWDAFKNQIEAKVKVQERLRAENRIQELEEKIRSEYDAKRMKTLMSKAESLNALKSDYNQKREEAAALRRLKDMRKALVKRVMRRVNFNSIDYTKAREIIAVQKVFEPNMRGGVNKWIGTENKLAREIWSAWNTDSEARDRMAERLTLKGKYDLIRLLDDVKNEEDFDRLTKKELSQIERAMPRQNWIKELGLDVWKEERDNALQLDIKEVERTVWVTDENGNRKEKVITTTEISPEIEELLIASLGQDMAYAIRNKHFEDWTTGEMEELARKINKMFKDGRDLLAAKRDAEKIEADRLRQKIRDAINNTGIVINDDDPEDIKKKKQAKIDKILGTRHELPGTAANQKEKEQTLLDRLLHSYHDANIRRVARILDNYSEGTWTNLLYWNENECFNKQERAKDRRNKKIEDAITNNKIDMRLLGKTIQIDGMTFTYDEVLMIWAAQMNQEDYILDQKKNNPYFDENNVEEESAYKAIKYGNLILPAEREAFQKMDIEVLEAEQQRKDNLQAAILANDQALIDQYKAIPSDKVDINGNIIMTGTAGLKALAGARFAKILASTRDIRDQMLPLIEAIRKDYSEEFDRINKVSIEVFNAPVWREKWYLPLIRKTMLGDTHEQRLKQDLLGHSAGTGKAGTEKGFTKKRIEIGALHQAPVELGLYTTWADSVERNEHFIAYAGYIRELNRVLFSKDALGTMQELEDRYGKAMKDYLEVYVKEIANPNYSEPKKGLDRVMHMLRGNTAPAYLGWKFSSILKQGIESPAPFMQFINPVEYMHGAIQLATKKWTRESIAAKSAFMKSRVFDPMVDLINENVEKSFSKKSYYLKKFQQKGMEGLEWIDWACVAPGWIAIYEKEYAKLQGQEQAMFDKRLSELQEQNETRFGTFHLTEDKLRQQAMDDVMMDIEKAAVDKADDCVRLCQPSNRNVDLSPMFKNNSEAAKAVLQFQTALNVIWQNIRYDIPYAIRNKEYANIVGMVLGYVMAGIISGVVTEGLKGKGDDDDPEEIAKKIGYYSTTQFIDSVPIVGGNLDALAKKAITGEGGSMYSSSLWPTFDKYYNGASALVSGDYEKALRNMEQGLFLTIGAPTSGIKEIEAALGAFDKDPGLELYPEAFLGRRK